MTNMNQYQAYAENHLVGTSPTRLIVALYEGAIGSLDAARTCFATGDIMGRGRAITKTTGILTELMFSLDMEKGGEVSANLKRLYSYMQQRVLAAHAEKKPEPLTEVEGLLKQMLDAWQTVARQTSFADCGVAEAYGAGKDLESEYFGELITEQQPREDDFLYTGYFLETPSSVLSHAYSF